jgi:8-oxo-dGTP pyrophosphatase MutT (NUDIX family)
MAPVGRKVRELEALRAEKLKLSAVMVVFCLDEQGKLFIPLTQRRVYQGAHSGQISLPGGKYEESDTSLEHTALRECREEIGLEGINLLGKLTELIIPVSNFRVQPFAGYYPHINPPIIQQEREVESLVKLMVHELLDDSIVTVGSVELPDRSKIKAPYFEVGGHKVWGATAMILSELKEVLRVIA